MNSTTKRTVKCKTALGGQLMYKTLPFDICVVDICVDHDALDDLMHNNVERERSQL